MEERSPGSYRFSIRGSLLRSPFGVRNIKIFLDEFPLTDAGGNTYLNLLDPSAYQSIEILKGPEGSLYGANTGGVVLFHTPAITDSLHGNIAAGYGSFNTFQQSAGISAGKGKYRISISQGYLSSDGFRDNSSNRRTYGHVMQSLSYGKDSRLSFFVMGSDLQYRTPGGLTKKQMDLNAAASRPATATLPSATEQKAGIFNRTLYAGVSNKLQILSWLKHVATVYASITDFKNPFITNYETREEQNYGVRTYLGAGLSRSNFQYDLQAGIQLGRAESRIRNYANLKGTAGQLSAADDIAATEANYFARLEVNVFEKISAEAAVSMNQYGFQLRRLFPTTEVQPSKTRPATELLPRLALSWKIIPSLAWRLSASKGFSQPTVAEIRPSDQQIHDELKGESGWNYESGLRFRNGNNRFYADAAVFRFELQNTIVRRNNSLGEEYFVNAGGTLQSGLEIEARHTLFEKEEGLLRYLALRGSYAYNKFRFRDYQSGPNDLSGNKLTGVPLQTFFAGAELNITQPLSFFINYQHVDPLPLNDQNTEFTEGYDLLEAKLIYKLKIKTIAVELYVAAANLLDEIYSSGNDLNAAGGRYYNPAMPRNYYGGMRLSF
jgi:iron complex outermembrane receptor protein